MRDGEDEPAAGAQYPGHFAEHAARVGDEGHRTVRRTGQVEDAVGERQVLRVRLHDRQRDAGAGVQLAGMPQLLARQLQADRGSALRTQPAPALPGAAADLQDTQPGDVTEQPCPRLVQTLGTPDEPGIAEEAAVLGLVRVSGAVPIVEAGSGGLVGRRGPPVRAGAEV